MKTHRIILIVSFIVSLISLLFVIILPDKYKSFQIALGLLGSSFIAFLLEIPNYYSLKKYNRNLLYLSLKDIKFNSYLYNNTINFIFSCDIVTDKFYEQDLQKILMNINNLKSFDIDYYFFKKKKNKIQNFIASTNNAFNNLHIASMKFSVNYSKNRLDSYEKTNKDRNITPHEMMEELNYIKDCSTSLIEHINKIVPIILSKDQYNNWLIDDSFIINFINETKASQNRI